MKDLIKLLLGICLTALAVAAQDRSVAVTFDDVPMSGRADSLSLSKEVNRKLLSKLKGIPATGFVNEGKLFVEGEIDERTLAIGLPKDMNSEITPILMSPSTPPLLLITLLIL